MKRKDYFLFIEGQRVQVSEEVYREYWQGEEKERYFMEYLKKGRLMEEGESHKAGYIPGREISYEQLVEQKREPQSMEDTPEERMIRQMCLESLGEALQSLSDAELELIREIFWQGKTERELAVKYRVSQMAVNKRKKRILEKLRKNL